MVAVNLRLRDKITFNNAVACVQLAQIPWRTYRVEENELYA